MAEDYSQGWIDFGPVDPANLIRVFHSLSSAQGLGVQHDSDEPLTDEELKWWLDALESEGKTRLDYVRGRSVKKSIHKYKGHYLIRDGGWYDHTDAELHEALARFGISLKKEQKHSTGCQCDDCQPNHPIRDPDKAPGLCGIEFQEFQERTFNKEKKS